jgi:hypothetical protein
LFNLILKQRTEIGRHPAQTVQGVIRPHEAVDKSIDLSSRPIDPDFRAAAPTFQADKPLLQAVGAGPFLNAFRVHPASAAAGQHGSHFRCEIKVS